MFILSQILDILILLDMDAGRDSISIAATSNLVSTTNGVPVDEDICISPDGGCEMSVQLWSKSIVVEFGVINISRADVECLVHTTSGKYPD